MLGEPSWLKLQGPEQPYYSSIIFSFAQEQVLLGCRVLLRPLQNSTVLVCLTPPYLWVRYRQVGTSYWLMRQIRESSLRSTKFSHHVVKKALVGVLIRVSQPAKTRVTQSRHRGGLKWAWQSGL